ncbi:MAG: polymorphic toxin type 50 domain-containing protein, partial [Ekhidna sp.]
GRGAINRLPVPNDLPTNIHLGQQGKHILGHNNFDPKRSPLTANPDDLLAGVHGGQYPIVRTDLRGNPVADFGSDIGSYVQQGQAGVPTRYGTIHYGKNGAHVVPANPNIN